MEWIKSHLLFCIFALIVLILVVTIIIVLAIQNKKEKDEKNRKGVALKKSDLHKKKEENIKMQKPILKSNLKTGEKITHKGKPKTSASAVEKNKEIEDDKKQQSVVIVKPKKVKKQQSEVKKVQDPQPKEEKSVKPAEAKQAKQSDLAEKKVKKGNVRIMRKIEVKKETETYRIVYDKEQKNWVVKIDGGERASRRCATKEEALKVAKDLAKKKDADLSVHKKNGKFQKQ